MMMTIMTIMTCKITMMTGEFGGHDDEGEGEMISLAAALPSETHWPSLIGNRLANSALRGFDSGLERERELKVAF